MKRLILLAALIISQIILSRITPAQNNQWINFDIWNSKLPNNSVYAVAIDQQGMKWFGTDGGGLTKFDGTHWTTYNTVNSPMYCDFVRCITIDQQGVKWIGTACGGLHKFDGTNWTVYSRLNSPLPDDWVAAIAIDSKGVKWLGLGRAGLVRFDDTSWTVYTTANSGLPVNAVYSVAIDANDVVWAGTNGGGTARFDGKTWTVFNKKNSGIHCNASLAIVIDKADNKWIATYTCGVVMYNGNDWFIYNKEDAGLNDNWVKALAMDSREVLWAGTDSMGLAYLNGNKWVNFDTSNSPLADGHICSIAIDKQGNKWIATYLGGVSIYNENGVNLPPVICVNSPNSNSKWTAGSAQTVSWASSSVTSNVNIKLSTDGGLTFPHILSSNIINDGSEIVNVPNVLSNTCRIKVESVSDAGLLALSPGSFSIVKLASPLLVNPANGAQNQTQSITLKWRKTAYAQRYRLQLSADNGFTKLMVNDSLLFDTSKTVSTLRQGVKYFWRVRAENTAGAGDYPAAWNFVTKLNGPDNLNAAMPDKRKIRLAWKDNSDGEAGFVVERKFAADFIVLDTAMANAVSFTDSLFNQPGSYQYRIRAFTADAVSDYSNMAQVLTTGVTDTHAVPEEFMLYQNYPNPFNPSTSIKYALPVQSEVEIVIYNIKGEAVRSFIMGVQPAGEKQVTWDGKDMLNNQAASGMYIVRLKADGLDGRRFVKSGKVVMLK